MNTTDRLLAELRKKQAVLDNYKETKKLLDDNLKKDKAK